MMNCILMPKSLNRKWFARSLTVGLAVMPLAMMVPLTARTIAAPSATVAQASMRPTLRVGSTGRAVSEIQAILMLLDYFDGPVDGKFQETTASAVQAFQADVGLNDDGIVGPATWEKLLPTPSTEFTPPEVPAETATTPDETAAEEEDAPVELPTLREGMGGPAVSRVQETLRVRGFYNGAVDGLFGPATEAAVKAFQRSVQLADDGVVGPATWQALLQ